MVATIAAEVMHADLGDARLDNRLIAMAEMLGSNPSHSIPAAAHSHAEMTAAYRFFDNDKVSIEKILAPHREATLDRIRQCDAIILAQDTTVVDLTRPLQQVKGAGRLMTDKQSGFLFHPLLAFNEDALCLGMVWQKNWTREPVEKKLTAKEDAKRRRDTPIEHKESVRWIEGIKAASVVAKQCPETECICVADSESDIYEVFSEIAQSHSPNFKIIVRAGQSRKTTNKEDWLKVAQGAPVLYTCSVQVSSRRAKFRSKANYNRQSDRTARVAELEVRATTITLKPPSRPDRKLPTVTVNVVLCEEPNPPEGCEPIRWLLVTDLPIETNEQVERIVCAYCVRWQIEIFFFTLKSGCRIEERLFEALPRTKNAIGLYCIVAWRILYLTHLGRECPDMCCEVVFRPSEWKAVYAVVHRTKEQGQVELPKEPPRLNEMIRMIASLGGYIHRPKQNSHPGVKTLWIGLQRAYCLSIAWEAFGPDSKKF